MKDKILLNIFTVIFVIFLFSVINSASVNANSVTISLFYVDTTSDHLTIMNGDQFGVIVSADSIFENSMTINLDLLDSNGNLIRNLLNVYTTNDSYFNNLIVDQSAYLQPGNYVLRGTVTGSPSGDTDVDNLYLEVLSPTPGNHPPVIISNSPTTPINEHEVYNYQVVATDEDNDPLTYSFIQSPSWLSINPQTGLVTGTAPEVEFDYEFIATVKAFDGLDFDTQVFTINVDNVVGNLNHAPILNQIGDRIINENQLLQFYISASDPDNNNLILLASNLPQGATFTDNNDNTGTLTWQTNFDDAGEYFVTFTTSDGSLTDSETIKITVEDVVTGENNVPTIQITKPLENETVSGVYTITWVASDLDQTANTLDVKLEYTYDGYDYFVLEDAQNNNDGIFTWNTSNLSDAQDYKIRATVTDDENAQAQDNVNFILDNLYSPNVSFIQPQENEIISGTYNILWTANDIDQDPSTLDIKLEYRQKDVNFIKAITRLLTGDWVTLEESNNNDGIFTWDTNTVDNGDYELRVIATDDSLLTSTAYLNTITINNIVTTENHNPVITSTPIITAKINESYNYDVNATDQDNDILNYSLMIAPEGMVINTSTGLITWIPLQEQLGNNSVIVRVDDGKGGFDEQSFNILITQEGIIPPVEQVISHVHEFSINNVILMHNESKLNVYAYIRNTGTEDERINVKATIMQNGMQEITAFNLDRNNNAYQTLTFDNLKKGFYIVKVDAYNGKFHDISYAYITI